MKILTIDFYKQKDKQKHIISMFFVSFISTVMSMFFTNQNVIASYFSGLGISASIGWIKELRDGEGFGTRDIDDIDADMVGANAGALVGVLFYMLIVNTLLNFGGQYD